ncbi:MAG: SGNH/GDSL hydrolase family protein [Bacteroidetes bacterium]|nr:SGNH/GDSL hydrolase family protein [Bacteroidota bacterium]MBI3481797.1 SGNH/GDSL hydrolase family protein [Bacteroidota bacterium]
MIVLVGAIILEGKSQNSGLKYLALGDSYTIGESVAEHERWPNQLAYKLGFAKPLIVATTGWRTDNLTNAISIAKLKGEYDLVSLLIGVNNQYQGKPIGQYSIEFEALLNTSIRLAKGNKENVFVVSIPDYGFTPFGMRNKEKISLEIDQFNEVAKRICAKLKVNYINITDISREALNDKSLVAPDGLHPSGKMYALWAARIAEVLNLK